MSLSARDILKSKDFKVKDDNSDLLNVRWNAMKEAQNVIKKGSLGESEIGLTNVLEGKKHD